MEGAAKAADAVSRDTLGRVLNALTYGPLGGLLEQQRTLAMALGPLRPFLLPLPLPGELVGSWVPLASKTDEDEAQLQLMRRVLEVAEVEWARSSRGGQGQVRWSCPSLRAPPLVPLPPSQSDFLPGKVRDDSKKVT